MTHRTKVRIQKEDRERKGGKEQAEDRKGGEISRVKTETWQVEKSRE